MRITVDPKITNHMTRTQVENRCYHYLAEGTLVGFLLGVFVTVVAFIVLYKYG